MRICSRCQRCYDDQVDFCTEHSHQALSETRSGSCEMVPGYSLDVLIESGFKGDLFRAHQIECGQACRVRILSPKKKSGHQFLREAKHLAALFHPNLVDIYDAGVLDSDEYFVVAEEPEGQTLREYLNAVGVPPLLSTIQMIEQTAEAVHALHQEGLLHRAVRPENIVLANDVVGRLSTRIKDIDLGGVTERSIISNKFLIDTALDAVRYFAPEQCTGGRTSVQTDVYPLGIVLYEMLAGVTPFDAPKASGLIEKHRHQRPPEIRIDNFDLRMLLTHTLTESLQKEPAHRHSTALAFARQLRHMEQLATHVSTPPPAIVVPQVRSDLSLAMKAAAPIVESKVSEPVPEPVVLMDSNLESEPQPEPKPKLEAVVPESESYSYDPWIEQESYSVFEHEAEPLIQPEPQIEEPTTTLPPAETLQTASLVSKARLDRASRLARRRLRKNRSQQTDRPETPKEIPILSEPEPEIATINEDPIESPTDPVDLPLSPPQFIDPEPDEITAVTARSKTNVIEWEQPDEDIPSLDDVLEVLSKEQIEPSFDPIRPSALEPAPPTQQNEDRPGCEPDEIQFLPSVMRKSVGNGSLDLYPNYSILSGYGATQARFSFDYQTLMLGAGLVALVLLFFVGNVMFKQYVTSEAPTAAPSLEKVFGHSSQPQIAQTNPIKRTQKTSQKPKVEDSSTSNNDLASPSASSEVRPQQTSNGLAQNQSSRSAVPGRNAEKPSSISSTLVISTENGKVRSVVETGKRSANTRSPVATNKITASGRPRVVGNPSQ